MVDSYKNKKREITQSNNVFRNDLEQRNVFSAKMYAVQSNDTQNNFSSDRVNRNTWHK